MAHKQLESWQTLIQVKCKHTQRERKRNTASLCVRGYVLVCVFVWFYDYILHERYTNMRSRAHFLSLRLFDRQTFVLTSCPSLSVLTKISNIFLIIRMFHGNDNVIICEWRRKRPLARYIDQKYIQTLQSTTFLWKTNLRQMIKTVDCKMTHAHERKVWARESERGCNLVGRHSQRFRAITWYGKF